MKNVLIFAIAVLMGFSSYGQRKSFEKNRNSNLSIEQRATLHAKKMALQLDLTDSQQKEMEKLFLKHQAERDKLVSELKDKKSSENFSSEDRFVNQSKRLDLQKSHKAEVKKVLTNEQFQKWEENSGYNKRFARGSKGKRPLQKNNCTRT